MTGLKFIIATECQLARQTPRARRGRRKLKRGVPWCGPIGVDDEICTVRYLACFPAAPRSP